jgi:hypothetical protein
MQDTPRRVRSLLAPLVGLWLASCSGEPASDPDTRTIAWTYAPTNSTATAEHMRATGAEGNQAITKGWRCKLKQEKLLLINPYQLAETHPLFGKVALSVGLFAKDGERLANLQSGPITAANASFQFELAPELAPKLWDIVLWYVRVGG